MNKRILAAVMTGAMAVSTALQAIPVQAASGDKYVMMNIPYSIFYNPAIYFSMDKYSANWLFCDNTSAYDAVTTATPKAMDDDMFPGTYHEREGVISGVTVPVRLTGKVPATGQKRDNVEDLVNGSDYDYYELSEESSVYFDLYEPDCYLDYGHGGEYFTNYTTGTPSGDHISIFRYEGWGHGRECALTASMEDGPDSEYKDVTIHIDSHGEDLGTVYGVVLVVDKCRDSSEWSVDKEYYALRHLEEIWTNTEYGFDLDGELAALVGKDIQDIYIYSSTGYHLVDCGYKGAHECSGLHVRKKVPEFEISTYESALTNWAKRVSGEVQIKCTGLPDYVAWRHLKLTFYCLDEQGNKVVIAETDDENQNFSTNCIYVSTDKIQNGQTYYVGYESDDYYSTASSNGLRFYNPDLDDEDDQDREETGGTDQGGADSGTSGDNGSGSTDTGKTDSDNAGAADKEGTTGDVDAVTDHVADDSGMDNADDADDEQPAHKNRDDGEDRHGTKYLTWVTTKAGTATTDGVMEYRCSECGKVKYRVPISAYYTFNKESEEQIRDAAQGATVKVDTDLFVSFHKSIVDELKARPDVALVVDYTYQGVDYEMTIPAGSGTLMEQLFGEDQFAGFRYLAGVFATVER